MIIDTHVHFGEILNFRMPEEMFLESMRKYKIDFYIYKNINKK
ncbi:hypothetical protein [Inconstantimicrobium porci]|nr:hypothetical protein [Inconstantimicrobium porci]